MPNRRDSDDVLSRGPALTDAIRRAEVWSESIRRATTLTDVMRRLDPIGESMRRATAVTDAMRGTDAMRESTRRASALSNAMRGADPIGESIRRATSLTDAMHRADVMSESIRRATALTNAVRHLDPIGESIRRATALPDAMRRAEVMSESIRRTNAVTDHMRCVDSISESIRRASGTFSSFERFHSVGMAAAAAAVGVPTAAAFATVWRSPEISSFAQRFLQDAAFNRELMERLQAWQFEDVDEEEEPDGRIVLSAVEDAIQNAAVGDRTAESKTVATALIASWEKLPAGLRQMVAGFIVCLISLFIEYCILLPIVHPQEPATQQKIREQRKLSAYAIRELGVNSTAFRITTKDCLAVYASDRRDSVRTGDLDMGQTVQIVQKKRNWCEVIWLDSEGRTRGGWVQTRYLRRL